MFKRLLNALAERAAKPLVTPLAIGMLAGVSAFGEDLEFRFLQDAVGKRIGDATCFYEDRNGYVYIGTNRGIHVFNGYDTETFQRDESDPSTIGSNFVSIFSEDREGRLWVGLSNGVSFFDRESGSFHNYTYEFQDHVAGELSVNRVMAIAQDSDGELILAFRSGIVSFDPERGEFKPINTEGVDNVSAMLLDKAGYLWIGTDENGLFRLDPQRKSLDQFETGDDGLSSNNIGAIAQDAFGQIWIGTRDRRSDINGERTGGLTVFDHLTSRFASIDIAEISDSGSPSINALAFGPDKRLWAGTMDGRVFCVNLVSRARHGTAHQAEAVKGIRGLMVDSHGHLWLGAITGPALIANTMGIDIKSWTSRNAGTSKGLADPHVTSILIDSDDSIWLGSWEGTLERRTREGALLSEYSDVFAGRRITSTIEDSKGKLWVGTYGNGIYQIDKAEGRVSRHFFYEDDKRDATISDNRVNVLLEDDQGMILVGHRSGIDRLDPETGRSQNLNELYGVDPKSVVRTIAKTSNGDIWWGGRSDTRVFDSESGKSMILMDDEKNSVTNASCIFEDSKGRVWVGTRSGLRVFTPELERLALFLMDGPATGDWVTGILEDNDGTFWISTTNGIRMIDMGTGQTAGFMWEGGFENFSYSEGAAAISRDGTMWFGGVNGIDSFSPLTRFLDSNVRIAIFSASDEQAQLAGWNDFATGKRLVLSHNKNNFRIDFSTLDFLHSSESQYSYRMLGLQDKWSRPAKDPFATFTNLDPGEYRFEVRGANRQGLWSDEVAAAELVITPAFWQTNWFRGASLFGIILAAWMLHKAITESIRRRNEGLKRANDKSEKAYHELETANRQLELAKKTAETANTTKSQFLANMSHEIRTPLNAIIGMHSLLRRTTLEDKQVKYFTIADKGAEALLLLLNDLLDISKIESDRFKTRMENFDLVELTNDLSDLTRFEIENKELEFRVYIDPDAPRWVKGDGPRLLQVLLNLIGNANKFTSEGSIELRIAVAERTASGVVIRFEVIDTGIGIAEDEIARIFDTFSQVDDSDTRSFQGAGLGLSICRQLVEKMGGFIDVESKLGEGSKFWFSIPLLLEEAENERPVEFDGKQGGSANPPKRARPKIMLVEDSEVNSVVTTAILEELGCDVTSAPNGKAFLEAYRESEFDLIFMDCQMPVLDGYEATRRLRRIEGGGARVPVIALTANAMAGDADICREAGMDDYLAKPTAIEEIKRMLKKWGYLVPA